MKRRDRVSLAVYLLVFAVLGTLYIIGFIWQRGFTPIAGGPGMEWWQGWLHGAYALTNLIYNALFEHDPRVEIFQSGSGGWYGLWWLIGVGAIFGGSKSAKRS